MSDERTKNLPVVTAAMCCVAMAALYVTSKHYIGLPLLAVALLGTYATAWRLPASPLLAWAIRVALFGTILTTANPDRRVDMGSMVFDPGYTNLFGFLVAGELVIRAWVRRRGGASKGEMVLLSALVLTAATNAGDLRAVYWVRTLAPVFVLLLVLTLRSFRDRPGRASWTWAAAMLLAVSIGLGSSWAVATLEGQITRWSMQFLSGKNRDAGTIGLGRTATLGRVFNPTPSDVRVLKLDGWLGESHLRVMTFDQYANGTWGPPIDQRDFPAIPAGQVKAAGEKAERVRVTRYMNPFGLLALPLETAALQVGMETPDVQQDAGGSVKVAGDDAPDPLHYSFTPGAERSFASASGREEFGVVARPITEMQRRFLTIVSKEIDPEVVRIAGTVATGKSAGEKLTRIVQYLQANHHYSLEVDPCDGDPVSAFLLKKLDGHCEYFAASAVMLARCAGIPARYVTGYYAHEPDGAGGTVVRERDAHAWAECWVEGMGWVTMDATPSGGRPDALFTETPKWRQAWERVQDYVGAVRAWLARRTLMEGAVMIAALAAIPVFLRVWRNRHDRQRRIVLGAYPPTTPELAAVANRFERILKRKGIVIPPNRTWRDQVAASPGVGEFLNAYDEARFGPPVGGSHERLNAMLASLEASP